MQNVTQDGILVVMDFCEPRYGSLVSIKCREFIDLFPAQERPSSMVFILLMLQVHHIFLHRKIS